MREIKFRAWDEELKKMCYPEELVLENGKVTKFLMSENSKRDYKGRLIKGKLMQFTGLKDKNGKEIYEGDILFARERVNSKLKSINIYVVKFGEYEYSDYPTVEESYGTGFYADKGGYTVPLHEWYIDTFNFYCVGNIFENPKLLDVK